MKSAGGSAPALRRIAPTVLAVAYRALGEALLRRLRGEFALLLWEPATGRGLLARDQFGARSLHYRLDGERLYFGSEVRDLLSLLPRRPAPDRLAICHWLALEDIRGGRTFFEGVRALEPGHLLRFGPDGFHVSRWWTPRYGPRTDVTLEEAASAVRGTLTTAIERACDRGAPTGILMSGGLDSTGVAALAKQLRSDALAYSGVFPTMPSVDESALVCQTSTAIGIRSSRMPIEAGSMLAGAANFPAIWDLPLRPQALYHWLPLMRRAPGTACGSCSTGRVETSSSAPLAELIADRLRGLRPVSAMRLARTLPGVRDSPGATRHVLRVHGLSAALPPVWQEAARRRRGPARYVPPWLTPTEARDVMLGGDEWAWKNADGPRWWARLADELRRRPARRRDPRRRASPRGHGRARGAESVLRRRTSSNSCYLCHRSWPLTRR